MEDIAPALLEKIQNTFKEMFEGSEKIIGLYEKVQKGAATYLDANEFAIETGELLARALQRNLSSSLLPDGHLYYNIAERILSPVLENNYDIIADVAAQVQGNLNKAAGIGIKAIRPEMNQDRAKGIVDIVSGKENYDDIAYMLGEPIVNFSQSIVDDTIKANVDFQGKAGLRPKIVRRAESKCCKWCSRLAGTYKYPDVPKDVYRRHRNCRCTVEYDPGSGKRQNVHSKQWKTQEEYDKIEARKTAGLIASDDEVMRHIRENIIPQQNIEKIVDRQQIHRVGTKMYEQRKASLESKGQYGPSYLTISDEEVLELVKKYSGKGKIQYGRSGQWNQQETIITNDKIVGVVFNNQTGKNVATSVFKIHYGKDGVHIVPDYPSKKR